MELAKLIKSIKSDLDTVKNTVQSLGEKAEATTRSIVGDTIADGAVNQVKALGTLLGAAAVSAGIDIAMKAATKRVATSACIGAATVPAFVPALAVAGVLAVGYVAYKAMQVSREDDSAEA